MTKKPAPKSKAKNKTASDKKLVGYWEERKLAESIHRALKDSGRDTSEFLRSAYRSVLNNGNGQVAWTMNEAKIARRVGLSPSTLKGMRERLELVDEHGAIWKKQKSGLVLYDVARTRKFFGVVDEQQPESQQAN